jgi:hypothetical protein
MRILIPALREQKRKRDDEAWLALVERTAAQEAEEERLAAEAAHAAHLDEQMRRMESLRVAAAAPARNLYTANLVMEMITEDGGMQEEELHKLAEAINALAASRANGGVWAG